MFSLSRTVQVTVSSPAAPSGSGTPIVISDAFHEIGRTVVKYADNLVPDRSDFASEEAQYGFAVDNGELQWLSLLRVVFNAEDNVTNYATLYVYPNSLIDGNTLPTPVKTGYTLEGWKRYGQDVLWDFAKDVVTGRMTLLASWKLNAPAVTLGADRTSAHPGETITLTANASHELSGVTYRYEWYRDGALLAGETGSTLAVTESGAYSVKVSAQTADAAAASSAQSEAITCTVSHTMREHPHKAATCTEAGNVAYWHCEVCGRDFADEAGTQELEKTVIPALGHEGVKVERREPTATEEGNIEYWYCEQCGLCFADETLTKVIDRSDTVLAATGEPEEPDTPQTGAAVKGEGDFERIGIYF